MRFEHPILSASLKWLVPPVAIALTLWLTPNITLSTADAGAFVSATPWAGSTWWGSPVTIVHTTRGAIAIGGVFSALHGEPLLIRDTNKQGMVVCAVRAPDTCAELSGSFVGAFTPVSGARVWLPHWIRWWLVVLGWVWAGLGAIYFIGVWLDLPDDCGRGGGSDHGDGAKEPSA